MIDLLFDLIKIKCNGHNDLVLVMPVQLAYVLSHLSSFSQGRTAAKNSVTSQPNFESDGIYSLFSREQATL